MAAARPAPPAPPAAARPVPPAAPAAARPVPPAAARPAPPAPPAAAALAAAACPTAPPAAAALAAAALAAAAACGGPAGSPPPPPPSPPAALAAPPAAPGDAPIARVNGRPVWASCAAAQLARGAASQRAALDECVAFELLAQAAEARGLAAAPEVRAAARRAAASRLVERDFEARYRAPADLGAILDRLIDRQRDQLDKPELRASAFARVEVPRRASPAVAEAARALAATLYAALAAETGLVPRDLEERAAQLASRAPAGAPKITLGSFRAAAREGVVPAYGDALFGIPEVGRVAAPARTEWGWDVVLLTELHPPRRWAREEVAAALFPEVRRRHLAAWTAELMRARGTRVEIAAEIDARLAGEPAPR
jgi:hypothetical protein